MPKRFLVNGSGDGKQHFPDEIKEKPEQHDTENALHNAHETDETAPLCQWWFGKLAQARGANQTVIVFGDAFAAKELPALDATRRGFALRMVETALVR